MRRALLLLPVLLLPFTSARADTPRRVEVVAISGIVDGPAESAINATIGDAKREKAELVVIQLDSKGGVDENRTTRLVDRIRGSRVPVVVWIPPEGEAANGAAIIAIGADYTSMGPGARIGPINTTDLARASGESQVLQLKRMSPTDVGRVPFDRSIGPRTAIKRHVVDGMATAVTDLLEQLNGRKIEAAGKIVRPLVAPDRAMIRFRKLGVAGGILHAAAKPSIVYLLLLLALVGIVFELFHPSTGPAGVAGLLSGALAVYGMITLHGSWPAFAAICVGIALFCIDLATERIAWPTIVGFLLLVAGSIFLFPQSFLRVSPYVLAFGVIAMTMFLLGAMTRVLRDLRAIARGELEVREAHPDGHGE